MTVAQKYVCLWMIVATGYLAIVGCSEKTEPDGYGGRGGIPKAIRFRDTVKTNSNVERDITELSFVDINGDERQLKEIVGDKNAVVVMTRGFAGYICPYCSTQTSRLISNYAKFADRDAEVVVVYPIETSDERERLDQFLVATRKHLSDPGTEVPFPILLDVELKAVDQLGIRKDLSKPATYILDKMGQMRFAYVGETFADRPSIKAMLDQLETLNEGQR